MRLLLLDNFDSFTYNLQHLLQVAGAEVTTYLATETNLGRLLQQKWNGLVLSPGPGRPEEARVALSAYTQLRGQIPILGVCLGMQLINLVNGGQVEAYPLEGHGITSPLELVDDPLFSGIPNGTRVTRYHSLACTALGAGLIPLAWLESGLVMAFRHQAEPTVGIQFHPESFLTTAGLRLAENWLREVASWNYPL